MIGLQSPVKQHPSEHVQQRTLEAFWLNLSIESLKFEISCAEFGAFVRLGGSAIDIEHMSDLRNFMK